MQVVWESVKCLFACLHRPLTDFVPHHHGAAAFDRPPLVFVLAECYSHHCPAHSQCAALVLEQKVRRRDEAEATCEKALGR
eukprot:7390658-Prymnesium_polylepis.2